MQYGSAMEYGGAAGTLRGRNEGFHKGQRKRFNMVAVLIALFVPWLLFCFVYAVLSFSLHYRQPLVTYAMATLGFLIGVCLPWLLATTAMKRRFTDPTYQPSWYIFLAATCFAAFVVAALAGQWNYTTYMGKYYNLEHLAHYSDVDTNSNVGQQLMDAGRIDFKKGTELDLAHSMGFKNHDLYCVSPIVTKGSTDQAQSVDFWAVGKNCCSGVSADFHCAGFSDRDASAAIRLLHDEDRPFYRLAVQQAEATYKLTATHPLFFEWVHDGQEASEAIAQRGYTNYFLGICAYFLIQIFLTIASMLVFSKMVHS